MKRQTGVTLIELVIVIAIIGILAFFGVPAYHNYVIQGNVPDATSNLAKKRIAMEQFFQDHQTYVNGTGCASDTASSNYFNFACPVAASASAYQIVATGKGSMAGFSYTIDQNNAKTTTIAAPADSAWIGTNNSCWITKAGGSC